MSFVHKQLMSLKLMANCARNSRACSSIDVHRLSFLDISSLAAPTCDDPSQEGMDAGFQKSMLWDLVGNRVEPDRLRIEQCGLSRSSLLMAPSKASIVKLGGF
jgi:hypothetical protein